MPRFLAEIGDQPGSVAEGGPLEQPVVAQPGEAFQRPAREPRMDRAEEGVVAQDRGQPLAERRGVQVKQRGGIVELLNQRPVGDRVDELRAGRTPIDGLRSPRRETRPGTAEAGSADRRRASGRAPSSGTGRKKTCGPWGGYRLPKWKEAIAGSAADRGRPSRTRAFRRHGRTARPLRKLRCHLRSRWAAADPANAAQRFDVGGGVRGHRHRSTRPIVVEHHAGAECVEEPAVVAAGLCDGRTRPWMSGVTQIVFV